MTATPSASAPISPPEPRPKVSVLITTYNQADTLPTALDSILAQKTDFEIEICLSDDCSTDSTPTVCERYAARYPEIIKYHRNSHNLGARDNYFTTMMRCRGKYIADLAGDDYWTRTDKLARQVAILDSDPDIVLTHTDWRYVDANTGETRPSGNRHDSPALGTRVPGNQMIVPILDAGDHMLIHSCTAVYRADVAKETVRSYPEWFANPDYPCEDMQLMCLLADRGDICYIDEPMLAYRVGHDQMTSAADPAKAFDFNFGTLRLRHDLMKFFMLRPREIPSLSRLAAYVLGLSRHARDRHRNTVAIDYCRKNGIRLPMRSRLRNLLFRITGR